jgi:hypothetical protein
MEERTGFDLPEDMDTSEEQVDAPEQEEEVEYEVDAEADSDEVPKDPQPKTVKKPYSPDEIKQILRGGDFANIDTSRLSEEGRAVMKAMQAGLTPKLQETADLRRELQEIKSVLKDAQPKPKPKDIYEAFDQDPDGTMSFVSQRIQTLIDQGADLHEIEKVREVREQLRDRRTRKIEEQAISNSRIQESVNALLRTVPDIEQKQFELREFAIEYMGMTPQEVDFETSLQARGMDAVKTISRINTAYEKLMAGKRAKAKVKTKTTRVEKSGGGFEKTNTSLKDIKERAKKTGNFRDYFMALED